MPIEIGDYYGELFQEVHSTADADGLYVEDAFFDLACSQLLDAGELDTADRAQYLSPRGMRVDGYGGDPVASDGILSLIIVDFRQSASLGTLTASDMNAIFRRLTNFVTKSLSDDFRSGLEETAPAFGLADLISSRWSTLSRIRMILVSNRVLSARVDGREAGEVNGVPVTYSVWDLGRFHRLAVSGQGQEPIAVDLERDFGGALPVLPAHLTDAGYESYLVVIPGPQLAAIYDRWGARLLEQNVRVFLQARGNVNKGIRNTIENDPEMFFAYNNGITATAERVETRATREGLVITRLENLQIVNGGQTTASIHSASRRKDADISRVFVQMKLSVVEHAQAVEIVPRISEYANSQNRINAADFFANHPFHVRMEGFSRRVHAPSPDGTFRESKWFYERARGQYQDARAGLSTSQRKKFDLEYPKRQVFSKTDLAKYLNVWRGCPHIVSRGAQKNFVEFAEFIGREWEKKSEVFSEGFYREAVVKALVFRDVEKLVTEQPWYQGGYRANVVAYTIAKLAHDTETLGRCVDFESIWRNQKVPAPLREALVVGSKAVHDIIVDPPSNIRNVTEWAKQQACWYRVAELKVRWPTGLRDVLLTKEGRKALERERVTDQKLLDGIEAQTVVVKAGGEFWRGVKAWGAEKGLLTPTERGVLDVAGTLPAKIPSERQSVKALGALQRLQAAGCPMKIAPE